MAKQAEEIVGGAVPIYIQLHNVHKGYIDSVNAVWSQAMNNFQLIQREFQHTVDDACRNAQTEEIRAAQDNFQRAVQEKAQDPGLATQYADAYRRYKDDLQKLIASVNMDEMNFADMTNLSQGIYMVVQAAMFLKPSEGQAAVNNPFAA